ncbi:MAG: Bro-N domain-containing protein [Prevotella sp.]
MEAIQIFNNPQFGSIRTAGTSDKPLFCAIDVARALQYANPAKAIIDHCKGVTVLETPTNGGRQMVKYISESDMYRLIFKSNAPKAEEFNT